MRTLTLVTAAPRPSREEIARMEKDDEHPRVLLFEDELQSDMMDCGYLQAMTGPRRWLHALLPQHLGQALAAHAKRNQYDAVISWGDPLSLLFGLLLKLTGSRPPYVALMCWTSARRKSLLLKAVHTHIDHIITWSSVQREIAIDRLGISPSKITWVPHPVDQQFWRPTDAMGDMICAAGNEMRDYATLVEAMRGLDIRCQIAAREMTRKSPTLTSAREIRVGGSMAGNVSVGPLSYQELRALYARSRFVVVPLRPTDSDHGVRVILEAMAMGKAVICSRVRGQVDVIVEGKTGIFVPQGDPQALRQAIQYLWEHPELAERMGRAGRRVVEERHTFDAFVQSVRGIVEETMAQRRTELVFPSPSGGG